MQRTAWALIPPSTSFQVSLSRPIFPEQKTIPLAFIAWEKTGNGAGAFLVLTAVMNLEVMLAGEKVKEFSKQID